MADAEIKLVRQCQITSILDSRQYQTVTVQLKFVLAVHIPLSHRRAYTFNSVINISLKLS